MKIDVKMVDGRTAPLTVEDKGDLVPGFDDLGNRFEALTAWMRVGITERYAQCRISHPVRTADIDRLRDEQIRLLGEMGVDLDALRKHAEFRKVFPPSIMYRTAVLPAEAKS